MPMGTQKLDPKAVTLTEEEKPEIMKRILYLMTPAGEVTWKSWAAHQQKLRQQLQARRRYLKQEKTL